jgi:hypothetical protein
MKAPSIVGFVVLVLLSGTPAEAQGRPGSLVRGDVSGTIGWVSVNKGELDSYEDWHSIVSGDGAFGWYWTDHLRTEVYAGATRKFDVYTAGPVTPGGVVLASPSEHTFASRRVGIRQQYQFGRNQWFHPSVGAGFEVLVERSSRLDVAVYAFDPVTRQSRFVRGAVEHPERTAVEVHALLSTGFKAYMHERVYFLMDGRVTFTDRPEQVTLGFGLGVDF